MRTTTIFLTILVLAAGPASAQETGITVVGSGTAEAETDVLLLRGTVSVDAKTAAEAVTKHRNASKRAKKAFEGLELGGLTFSAKGPSFELKPPMSREMAMMMGRGGNADDSTRITLKETIEVRVTGLGQMPPAKRLELATTVIDTASDLGLLGAPDPSEMARFGFVSSAVQQQQQPGTSTTFDVADEEALQRKATLAAVQDARARAASVAKNLGVALGPVIAVSADKTPVVWTRTSAKGRCRAQVRVVFAIAR